MWSTLTTLWGTVKGLWEDAGRYVVRQSRCPTGSCAAGDCHRGDRARRCAPAAGAPRRPASAGPRYAPGGTGAVRHAPGADASRAASERPLSRLACAGFARHPQGLALTAGGRGGARLLVGSGVFPWFRGAPRSERKPPRLEREAGARPYA